MQTRKPRIKLTPAQVVRNLRLKKCWTQNDLSKITGIAVANISNIENGRSRLGEDRAILIARALGVGPEFILFPNGFEREELKPRLLLIDKRLKHFKKAA